MRFGGDLKAIDTRATPGVESRKKAQAAFEADAAELASLQGCLYARLREGVRG